MARLPSITTPRVNSSNPLDFALDQTNESILGPLEAYKQYVNVYQGFQYWAKPRSSRGCGKLPLRLSRRGFHSATHQRRTT